MCTHKWNYYYRFLDHHTLFCFLSNDEILNKISLYMLALQPNCWFSGQGRVYGNWIEDDFHKQTSILIFEFSNFIVGLVNLTINKIMRATGRSALVYHLSFLGQLSVIQASITSSRTSGLCRTVTSSVTLGNLEILSKIHVTPKISNFVCSLTYWPVSSFQNISEFLLGAGLIDGCVALP